MGAVDIAWHCQSITYVFEHLKGLACWDFDGIHSWEHDETTKHVARLNTFFTQGLIPQMSNLQKI